MAEEEKKEPKKTLLEQVLPTALVAVISSAATLGVASLTFYKDTRELDIEMVRLSLSILKGEYEKSGIEEPIHARRFALKALTRFSGVEMSENEIEAWAQRGGVPYSGSLRDSVIETEIESVDEEALRALITPVE